MESSEARRASRHLRRAQEILSQEFGDTTARSVCRSSKPTRLNVRTEHLEASNEHYQRARESRHVHGAEQLQFGVISNKIQKTPSKIVFDEEINYPHNEVKKSVKQRKGALVMRVKRPKQL